MHEGAIVKSLFDIAQGCLSKTTLKEVHEVKVVIGKLHHVVTEVIQMYFNAMKEDYEGFADASLIIEERDPVIKCAKCGQIMTLKDVVFICTECNSMHTDVVQGNEMYIESMEGRE